MAPVPRHCRRARRGDAVVLGRGLRGASLATLTEAKGINRRSIYAAFGNKEELFRKAADRDVSGAFLAPALEQPTALQVAEAMLHGAVDSHTTPGCPRGCLLVQSALAASPESEPVRRNLAERREAGVVVLAARFTRARPRAASPPGVDAEALARYVNTVGQGPMSPHGLRVPLGGTLQHLPEPLSDAQATAATKA
ncbi:TetR/AcrR family transcriptional regulator [Streptomyces mirabilis]|uniref:TetR/AcrR family transcriptional regulator n=1 Tax=Streptomyces mirabilis TaxID=68239 RepID=UPI00367E56C2